MHNLCYVVAVHYGIIFLHRISNAIVELLQDRVVLEDNVARASSVEHCPLGYQRLLTIVPHMVYMLDRNPVFHIMKLILNHSWSLLRFHEALNDSLLILILRASTTATLNGHGLIHPFLVRLLLVPQRGLGLPRCLALELLVGCCRSRGLRNHLLLLLCLCGGGY